ncbi:MAG: hypothetical protein Q4G44_08065 [Alcaligenaceae bacterium]|nr:hypothetical protein [Alcaligenaceae bacterium]
MKLSRIKALIIALLLITPLFNQGAMAQVESLRFSEMYDGITVRGIVLSDKLKNLEGKKVKMMGFMAPPLTPTINFFVMSQIPMAICPFCSSDADWPDNIVVVKVKKSLVALPFDRMIAVSGTLEVGSAVDEETGFVSLVRIVADNIETVN